ncbi:MAG: hypothetical protein WC570_05265 [Patescibacteria group bacterium]
MKKVLCGLVLCLIPAAVFLMAGCLFTQNVDLVQKEGAKGDRERIEEVLVNSNDIVGGEYAVIFDNVLNDKAVGWFRAGDEKSGWKVWAADRVGEDWELVTMDDHQFLPCQAIQPLSEWVGVADVCYRDDGWRVELWDEVEYPFLEEMILNKYGSQIMLAKGNIYGWGDWAAGSFNYSWGPGVEPNWHYFAAVKQNGQWQVVADAEEGGVACAAVVDDDFPSEVLMTCLDDQGMSQKRDFLTANGAKIKLALNEYFDLSEEEHGYDQINTLSGDYAEGWVGQSGSANYHSWVAGRDGDEWRVLLDTSQGKPFNCRDVERELVPLDVLDSCYDDNYDQSMSRILNRNEAEILPDRQAVDFMDKLVSDLELSEFEEKNIEYFWNGESDQIPPIIQAISLKWPQVSQDGENYYLLLENYLKDGGFEFKNSGQATVAGSVMYLRDNLGCTVSFSPSDYEIICGVL